jgi:tRNA uridine 5-carboxymethylaminomethyl modification enzyme
VLTTGTFLEGLLHIGELRRSGGRAGDRASRGLSEALRRLGLETGRLKTGTCPRLDGRTIDYSVLEEQPGDDPPPRFSFDDPGPRLSQISCYVTHTNGITHRVIQENLHRSPLYSGQIRSRGPRYCPSIEDKVVKFPDRDRHRIFLEPEGLDTHEVYPNGLSTSLPLEAQRDFVRTIRGLENATMVRPGYAIEYDYVVPTQLDPSLSVRGIDGLFLAGQINGTTGYEEAAAQGLMAGINAVRYVRHQKPFTLTRSEAYIGVLIDDLVTRGVDGEPYRMFTSRAEYRLLLREDNADLRLADQARELALLGERRLARLTEKAQGVSAGLAALERTRVQPSAALNDTLAARMSPPLACTLTAAELLRRPGVTYSLIASVVSLPRFDFEIERQLEITAAYQGYIDRIGEEVERMRGLEAATVPTDLDYRAVAGLSSEAREKLERVRPLSLGQASRISGLTPTTVAALAVHLKRLERAR